jgi:6-phosphogluconolactonase
MKTDSHPFRELSFVVMAALLIVLFAGTNSFAWEDRDEEKDGTVYVMANQALGNSIVVLHRGADGSLIRTGEVSTGGLGSGPGPLPARFGGGPGPDPLTSSDALVLTRDGRFLIAVNAGSNELSVLAVTPGSLQLVDKVPSGGEFPVSIANHQDLVYVLNQRGTPNITGFFLDSRGRLRPIPNSTQSAGSPGSSASEIAFSPDGDFLLLTETLADTIHMFQVGEDGRAERRASFPSVSRTPSALAFTRHNILAVTEAAEIAPQTGAPHGSSTTSYRLTAEGALEPISRSVRDEETATCWIRFTHDSRFAYVSSMGTGTISSYSVSPHGELTLLAANAADTGGAFSVPLDLAMSHDTKYLYVLAGLIGTVQGYRVESDGSLRPVASVGGFPISMQGIAAR